MCADGKRSSDKRSGVHSDIPYVKDMEEEMLVKINSLGIGPGGLEEQLLRLQLISIHIRHILQGFR